MINQNPLQMPIVAPDGSLRVASEDSAPVYGVCTGLFAPAATPTDVVALSPQNFGRSLSIKKVIVRGLSTAGGQALRVRLQLSPNGGTPGSVSYPTPFAYDPYDGPGNNATGFVFQFGANRTVNGDGVGSGRSLIDEKDMVLGLAGTGGSAGTPVVFDFTGGNVKCPCVKWQYQWVVVNLNGQTMPAGTQISVTIVWQEQRIARVAAIGDSTTALATTGFLNGGNNAGGMGASGLLNSVAAIDNLGSNGFRLWDYLNAANGVTYSAQSAQNGAYDIALFSYGINDIRQGLLGVDQPSATNQLTAMIDAAIYSLLNGTTAGQTYVSPLATPYAISSITWSGGVATVTTVGAHGFGANWASYSVAIAGCTPSGYNGTYTITVTGANTFTFALVSNPGALTVAGAATFAILWATTNAALPDARIILQAPAAFTTDDAGDGPHYYLSAAGNSTLSGLWNGLTLAVAAELASTILANAYRAFVGDARIFVVVQKNDVLGGYPSKTTSASGVMANQIHPNARGQTLEARQVWPQILSAIAASGGRLY
jgi:hypothetical protein